MADKKSIVFLISKNPATIGGVQRHNARLLDGLSGAFNAEKVVWRGPEWGAPFYYPFFYYKSTRNGARLIHCDDAVTSILGSTIKKRTGKPVVGTVHGLDVILPIKRYQDMVSRALRRLDRVICVSGATARQVERRGVPQEKIEIIPNAAEKIDRPIVKNDVIMEKIKNMTGIDLKGKKVLFSLGRPLRRKGFDYFIRNIFVNLPDDFLYIVAGPPQREPFWLRTTSPFIKNETRRLLLIASGCDSVSDELERLSAMPRVHYLKTVSEELRDLLFAGADLFIMPNRTVPGDMEGFGIVALEAAVRGVPVVATGIEGIPDAVVHGRNGFCVAENDDAGMIEVIVNLTADPDKLNEAGDRARIFSQDHFAPEKIYSRYEKLFEELLLNSSN
jgi:glycosyltransferase involved in cell wall biosynthesis